MHYPASDRKLVRESPILALTALAALAVLLLGGCASDPKAISLGLSQLGTEESVDAGSLFGGLSHRRSYNITGLGALDVVGLVSIDPDPPLLAKLRLSRARLPDNLAMRLSPDCSMTATADYSDAGVTADTVSQVRQALAAVENAQAESVFIQAQSGVLKALAEAFADEKRSADALAKATAAVASTKAAATATPADKTLAKAAADALAEETKDKGISTQKAAFRKTYQQILESQWPGLGGLDTTEKVGAALTSLAPQIAKLQGEQVAAQKLLDAGLNSPGVLISRWALAKEKVSAVGVADVASASEQSQEQQDGYLILGNARVVTLMVGDDFLWRACKAEGALCQQLFAEDGSTKTNPATYNVKRSGMDSTIAANRQYITTYQLLAQHWSWTEDRSLQRARQLQARLDQLLTALQPLAGAGSVVSRLMQVKVELQISSSLALSASNSGLMKSPRISVQAFSFATDDDHSVSLKRQISAHNGYGRIVSMRTTLDNYVVKRGENAILPKAGPGHCSAVLAAENTSFGTLLKACDERPTLAEKNLCRADYQQLQSGLQNWLQR